MGWLQELPKPIGIMACNDLRGRHILDACRQLNLRVPEDVAVVGVDNDELMCELAVPPLSSVAQGSERLGYEAAKLLGRLIRGRCLRPKHIVVPPISIVPRRSSDLIAVDDPLLSAALRFIQNHAAEQIGVPDVVRNAGVSRSTLETRFRTQLARTIHDEIQRVRIETARRLLTATNLSLSKIAERAGYRNSYYMSAVFRRELGVPPSQLRQEAGMGLWQ
jgi:LacI family transcriptional regulator